MNVSIESVAIGSQVAFGLATMVLYYTVTKLFANVDSALDKIATISTNLAIITTELEHLKKDGDNIVELKKDVAILKNEVFGEKQTWN